jgi:hypothetical protein
MMLPPRPVRAIIAVLATGAIGVAVGPVTDPGDRTVAPGPSAAELAEEHRTATPREQQQLLAGVQRLVACARAKGADVPDAQVDPHGAIIPWPAGQPAPEAAVAVAACVRAAADED